MTVFTVSNSADLYNTLKNVTGGDTIKLAAGDYGELVLDAKSGFDVSFDSPVTIISADLDNPATFTGMSLKDVKNLTVDAVVFDYTYDSADEIWQSPFSITNSKDITISNSLFDGDVASGRSDVADGYGFAKGLVVRGSDSISIENNEFTTWHRAFTVAEGQDINVSGNDIHSIRSDGMNFVEVQSVLIEDNYIHDFKGSLDSADHRDMIQFWTNGSDSPSTDITIRGNILDIGDGDFTQSIFMRNDMVDRGLAGSEMFYQNILIEENVILNGHSHGITMGETAGLIIRNNSILSVDVSDDNYNSTPVISISKASTSVSVQQNAVATINGYDEQTDWSLNHNSFVQNSNRDEPGYYAEMFLESSMNGPDGVAGYVVNPGSMLDILSAGSSLLVLDTTPKIVTPNFDVASSADTLQTLVFDATHSYGPAGQIDSEGATFIWDFGDGTTATGRIVEHQYDVPGNYDVMLEVLLDGQEELAESTAFGEVAIAGTDILAFDADDGAFHLLTYGAETIIDDSNAASVGAGEGMVVDLGGAGTSVEVAKENLSRFFGTDAFEMSMMLQADKPGTSSGEVARVHSSFIVSVQEDGDLTVELFPDTGERISLTTQGVTVNDGAVHDISVVFDGPTDSLQILIDGSVVASQTVVGSMPEMGSWGLVFGEPWGGQNFDGKLSAFTLDATSIDYPIFNGELEGPGDEQGGGSGNEEPEIANPDPENGYDEGGIYLPLNGFEADFDELRNAQLRDDAHVKETSEGSTVHLDGEADFVRIGKLTEYEESQQVSFSTTWSKNSLNSDNQRLGWNNKNVGVSVEGDGLKIYVGQEGKRFNKAIDIKDLGLDDTETHQVTVLVDAETDHLQVVLDGELVLNSEDELDITFSGGIDHAWRVGGGRSGFLDGVIHDFQVDDSADFVSEDYVPTDDGSTVA